MAKDNFLKTYPNQRFIYINKPLSQKALTSEGYLKVRNDILLEAMYNLHKTKGSFAFYIWLMDNASGYSLPLYPVNFYEVAHISEDTYRKAFKELEDKGYLVLREGKKTVYDFHERGLYAEKVPTLSDDYIVSSDEIVKTLK